MRAWRSAELPVASAGGLHDDFAPHYDAFYADVYGPLASAVAAPVLRLALQMPVGTRPCALDVGAGTGRLALPLAAAGWRVVAVEKSRGMLACLLDKAAAAGLSVEGWLGEMAPGVLEPESADAVLLAFGVVDYVVDDADLRRMAVACREAAKPGALAFVQPTPREYFVSGTQAGRRYRWSVKAEHRASGHVALRQTLTLRGAVVAEETIPLRVRDEADVARLFVAGGWRPREREPSTPYPVLVFEAA